MTLRIEKSSDGGKTFLRLIGRIRREHLEDLRAQIGTFTAPTAIDMESVTLVDVDVVRFLGIIELQGIEVLHCSPYIREWIRREIEEEPAMVAGYGAEVAQSFDGFGGTGFIA